MTVLLRFMSDLPVKCVGQSPRLSEQHLDIRLIIDHENDLGIHHPFRTPMSSLRSTFGILV